MIAAVAALREEVSDVLRRGTFRPLNAPGEALAYRGSVAGGPEALVLLTGSGRARAETAARWLLGEHRPDAVLSLGFAGGTAQSLGAGELILATEVSVLEGTPAQWGRDNLAGTLVPDARWLARARRVVELGGLDFHRGRLVSLSMLAKTSGMKRWLGETCGALGVDMESYYVGQAAKGAGVPFVCVRAVLDTVEVDLPVVADEMDGTPSGGRLLPALAYGLRHPAVLPRLVGLGLATTRARRTLAAFTVACLREAARTGRQGA